MEEQENPLLMDHRQRFQRQNDGDELGNRNICGSGQIKTPSGVRDRKGAFKRERIYYSIKREEKQVVTIFKALMSVAEEYIGEIHEAELDKKDPSREYKRDEIIIDGIMKDGRTYHLILNIEDGK